MDTTEIRNRIGLVLTGKWQDVEYVYLRRGIFGGGEFEKIR